MARQLRSLVAKLKEKKAEAAADAGNQPQEQRRPGRPQSNEEKVRLNFVVNAELAADLKALSSIKRKSLTAIFADAVAAEIAENRKEIDIIRKIQD